jgi:DNA mismatch repair protein MutS
VPAQSATLPIVDRIFTRIGAGDNVAQGKSTFLVEMEETAVICAQATERSLVILDEVGRGTSTYDGLAIAQAVVEYLHTVIRARCLFATHYHELSALEQAMPDIVNYHATSMQTKSGIVFLYKIARGTADGSFGIEVAKLAQLPAQVIGRAREILIQFDGKLHQI